MMYSFERETKAVTRKQRIPPLVGRSNIEGEEKRRGGGPLHVHTHISRSHARSAPGDFSHDTAPTLFGSSVVALCKGKLSVGLNPGKVRRIILDATRHAQWTAQPVMNKRKVTEEGLSGQRPDREDQAMRRRED